MRKSLVLLLLAASLPVWGAAPDQPATTNAAAAAKARQSSPPACSATPWWPRAKASRSPAASWTTRSSGSKRRLPARGQTIPPEQMAHVGSAGAGAAHPTPALAGQSHGGGQSGRQSRWPKNASRRPKPASVRMRPLQSAVEAHGHHARRSCSPNGPRARPPKSCSSANSRSISPTRMPRSTTTTTRRGLSSRRWSAPAISS